MTAESDKKDSFVWDDVLCGCGYFGPGWAREIEGDDEVRTIRDYCPECGETVEEKEFEKRDGVWFR